MLRLPSRIHKRPFAVALLVVLTMIVLAGIFIFSIGRFGARADLPTIEISSLSQGMTVNGIGLNTSYLPISNLLKNPSFENRQIDQVYTVAGGTENSVFLLNDVTSKFSYPDNYFAGAKVRILSLDQDGNLVQRVQGTVSESRLNQLGLWNPLALPDNVPQDLQITDLASSSGVSVAVGAGGLLVSDIASSTPMIQDMNLTENFVGISCILDRFFAVTDNGTFVTSTDGKAWNTFPLAGGSSDLIRTVSSLGKTGIAAGDNGKVLICAGNQVSTVFSGTNANLLASAGDGSLLLIAGEDNTVLLTGNGIQFKKIDPVLPVFTEQPNWQSADCLGSTYALGGDKGQFLIGDYSQDTGLPVFSKHLAKSESGHRISIKEILLLPSQEIVIKDDSGQLFCSNDRGDSWKLLSISPLLRIDALGLMSSGRILLSQGIASYITQLYLQLQLDEAQSENVFVDGDLCFLSLSVPSVEESANAAPAHLWQPMGLDTVVNTVIDSPSGGGQSSLVVSGSQEDNYFVSQVLNTSGSSPFQSGQIYRLDVWLKQEGMSDGGVMAWVSGNFPSFGTTFTSVGNGWRLYSYTFIPPGEAAGKDAGEIRFNIGFTGHGKLYVDRTYLGLSLEADSPLAMPFVQAVQSASPSLLRLDNVSIGRLGSLSSAWIQSFGNEGASYGSDGFVSNGVSDLETSLLLTRNSGANPWLVLDSATDPTTIDQLMGYLCGGISDPIGKIRLENGTAIPWSTQFGQIVMEISDSEGIFAADLQKSAYVNYIINLIKSSPYYLSIKGKVVFIDGMAYTGGTMLSLADYHAGDLFITNKKKTDSGQSILLWREAVTEGYLTYFDSIPRTPSRPQNSNDEWIRSSSHEYWTTKADKTGNKVGIGREQMTMANFAQMILYDLGHSTYTLLSDVPISRNPAEINSPLLLAAEGASEDVRQLSARENQVLLATQQILSKIVTGEPTKITWTYPVSSLTVGSDQSSAAEQTSFQPNEWKDLYAYSFKQDNVIHSVFVNTGSSPLQFFLVADKSLKGIIVNRYDPDGHLLEEVQLGQRNNRLTILPGQVMMAEIAV